MENNIFRKKILDATKWSTITEVASKLVLPVSNMILARILAPEAFGVIVIVTMIISFAEMLSDAGFQKYIVQQDFLNIEDKYKTANVAFISNMFISTIIFMFIFVFRNQIVSLLGNKEISLALVVASSQILFSAFSSIQISLFRRAFNFKTLFMVRIITIIIPFVVTIPIALVTKSYWALIVGTLVTQLVNAFLLTIKSEWKPKLFFEFSIFKKMISFSSWSLIEAISIWLTVWIDAFIVGYYLNEYFLGLYKTSTTMVNALLSIVTASLIPVLFSSLSRLKNEDKLFKNLFYKFQKNVSLLLFPLGVGIFVYKDFFTTVLLGSKWTDASEIVGVWAITSVITIVIGHFSSEVYRAKGRPKLSFLAQCIHLLFLIPTILISIQYSFVILIYARSLIRFQLVITHLIFMKKYMNFRFTDIMKNLLPSIGLSIIIFIVSSTLNLMGESSLWKIFSVLISMIIYFILVLSMGENKNLIIKLIRNLRKTKLQKKLGEKL